MRNKHTIAFEDMDFSNIREDDLVDIKDIKIDESLPKEEKINLYLKQIKNPYFFKCNGINVRVKYTKNGPTFEECIMNYLKLI
ncbi:MAG: hypothetical protein MJA82_20380 [Clostridia bacterium]|nr:hypothetical protein [Clostridia bacterium]